MSDSEKLCLKWNDFQNNISSSFQDLRNDKDFTDVTLVCGDNQRIEAHKVVLASASEVFKNILKGNKHPHPLIYMRGIDAGNFASIIDFVYYGETNVFQNNLESFLLLATELDLMGLAQKQEKPRFHHIGEAILTQKEGNVDEQIEMVDGPEVHKQRNEGNVEEQIEKKDKFESEVVQMAEKEREDTDGGIYSVTEDENEAEMDIPLEELAEISKVLFDRSQETSDKLFVTSIFDESPVKKESAANVAVKKEITEDVSLTEENFEAVQLKKKLLHAVSESKDKCGTSEIKAKSNYDPLSEIEHQVENLLAKEGGYYKCLECNHARLNKGNVVNHIESKHLKVFVICRLCNVTTTTRHALVMHMARKHPGQKQVRKPKEEQKTLEKKKLETMSSLKQYKEILKGSMLMTSHNRQSLQKEIEVKVEANVEAEQIEDVIFKGEIEDSLLDVLLNQAEQYGECWPSGVIN